MNLVGLSVPELPPSCPGPPIPRGKGWRFKEKGDFSVLSGGLTFIFHLKGVI